MRAHMAALLGPAADITTQVVDMNGRATISISLNHGHDLMLYLELDEAEGLVTAVKTALRQAEINRHRAARPGAGIPAGYQGI